MFTFAAGEDGVLQDGEAQLMMGRMLPLLQVSKSLSITSIRASVDALCRDDTSEISSDPVTKHLLTPRERLACRP